MAATTTHNAGPRPGQQAGGQPQSGNQQQSGTGGGMAMRPQQPDHREGVVARSIEHYTAQLPSDTFLWAALGSIGVSLALRMGGAKHDALFVGQWAPTFLLLGLYNKLVKVAGSDPQHRGMAPNAPTMASGGAGI
jgi:hypothetical protein